MRQPSATFAYREAATQQASGAGLVIMLYDALIGDLRRAVAALEAGDIESRCRHLKHGFLVLQQLDGLLDMERGGVAAKNLRRFYGHLRSQMLLAQFDRSAAIFERQITLILEVRSAWQQVDGPAVAVESPATTQGGEQRPFSCTA